jgi:hypothetical protein
MFRSTVQEAPVSQPAPLPLAATIPFRLHDREGQVVVCYGANQDPVYAGFDALAGLGFDLALCAGYPAVHARIEAFAGTGYRTFCGWVQIITGERYAVDDPTRQRPQRAVDLDQAPTLAGCGLPFCAIGNRPELFDAPCRNLGSSAELRWVADTFLVTAPARSRQQEIVRLAGFRWGYTEAADQAVRVHPLRVTDASAWNAHLPFLRGAYSGWRFREG